MKINIISENDYWKLTGKYRVSDEIFIIELKGKTDTNKGEGRDIYLKDFEQRELKRLLEEAIKERDEIKARLEGKDALVENSEVNSPVGSEDRELYTSPSSDEPSGVKLEQSVAKEEKG